MQENRRHVETQTKRHMGRRRRKGKGFRKSFRSGGEENERRMANNVMRGRRVYDGTWYVFTWRRSPRQRRQKSFLLPLEHALVFP